MISARIQSGASKSPKHRKRCRVGREDSEGRDGGGDNQSAASHMRAGSGSPHFAHFANTLDPSGWLPVTALRRFVYERSHTVGVILPYDASCAEQCTRQHPHHGVDDVSCF